MDQDKRPSTRSLLQTVLQTDQRAAIKLLFKS